MLVGLLSDSHGRAAITGRAIEILESRGCELLLHLGDVETDSVIDEMIDHPVRLVLGNCDDERSLARYAELVDVRCDHPAGRVEVDGRVIAFTHGHIGSAVRDALDDGVDYLAHGHTHEMRDERLGSTRVINPGALFRAARYTVAILDPASDRLEFIDVPRDP